MATLVLKNCGAAQCGTAFSGTVTQTTCSSDTPQFLDTNDFHLDPGDGTDDSPGDTVWRDQGTDLSATFTDDIDGETRPTGAGTWDIGADQSSVPRTPLKRTMAEALRDPFTTLHWLLEIDSGGITRRFADAGVSVFNNLFASDILYAGALAMASSPRIEVDPYTALASACSCTAQLLPVPWDDPTNPLLRPCDLEDATADPIIGSPARVYRWAEGTPAGERELIIDGHVISASADKDGSISLEISDFSVWYGRYKLPWYVIHEETWPNGEYDDRGLRAPICFGTFSQVKVVSTDATNNYEMISHHIGSTTAGRVGNTSKTPVLTNTTDSDGVLIARLDYEGVDTDNNIVIASGTGYVDDANGTYTGTASAVLTHVAEQLKCLAVEIVRIPVEKVDAASFAETKNRTNLWINALVIEDDESTSPTRETKDSATSKNLFSVGQSAMVPYVGALLVERGKLRLKLVDLGKPSRYHLREHGALLNWEEIEWSDVGENVPAGIEIKYDYGWSYKYQEDRYRQVKLVKPADYPPFARAEQFGATMKTIDAEHLRDAATVGFMVDRMLAWYSKTRRRWTVIADRETNPVEIFDVIAVTASKAPSADGLGFVGQRGIVVGIEYGLGKNNLTLLEV